jgi:hypothetical protein
MNPRATFVWALVASLCFATALGGGACGGNDNGPTIPPLPTPPPGDTFPDGVTIGSTCSGDIYVMGTTGWAFCDNGVWEYTTVDPEDCGFGCPEIPPGDDADDASSGDDSGDDASGDDDSGDDASGDDATGDDATTDAADADDAVGDANTADAG